MACSKACKGIGSAVIGSTFVVGCIPCPKFPSDARKVNNKVQLYRKKFQKQGTRIA